MNRSFCIAAALVAFGAFGFAAADIARTKSPPGAQVYFIAPQDGEEVANPVVVRFGLKGMGVAPAGVAFDGAGHHHLIVDADAPPLNAPIPADANHVHFGRGQTETAIQLEPGKHTLLLALGDHLHIPHDPPVMSEKITITVKQ